MTPTPSLRLQTVRQDGLLHFGSSSLSYIRAKLPSGMLAEFEKQVHDSRPLVGEQADRLPLWNFSTLLLDCLEKLLVENSRALSAAISSARSHKLLLLAVSEDRLSFVYRISPTNGCPPTNLDNGGKTMDYDL